MPISSQFSRVLCGAALLAACYAAETYAQMINPSFEGPYNAVASTESTITGVVANGWIDNSSWANVNVDYEQETSDPHSGASCQKIIVSEVKSGQVQLYQGVPVTAGYLYRPGIWLRGTAGVTVHLILQMAVSPYTTLEDDPVVLTSNWAWASLPVHITQTQRAAFIIGAPQPVTFWVDDAALPGVRSAVAPQINTRPQLADFGMHINNYLGSQGPNNLNFEGAFVPIASSEATITGQLAQNWVENSDWASVTVNYAANTTSPHSGKAAQRAVISQITSGNVQFAELVSLNYGQTYSASIWLRGTPGMQLAFGIRQWLSPYAFYGYQSVTATGAWQQLSVSGTPNGAGVSVLMVVANSTGTLDADDAQLLNADGSVAKLGLPWPSVPIGTWRLWDQAGTTWAALEPQKGVWNFALLDKAVADASAHGTHVFMTLGQTPTWASARPTEYSSYGLGAAAEPANMSDWVTYLQTVATRYKGQILNYEIWNEPNDTQYFSGSMAALLQLSQLAYTTLKQVDPSINVIGPAPYSLGYLNQFLQGGGGNYLDTIGYHIYDYTINPENDASVLADLQTVAQVHVPRTGGGSPLALQNVERQSLVGPAVIAAKPIWITEGADGTTSVADEVQAAGLLARKYLVQFLYGSAKFNWYTWGPASAFCLATTEADGITPSKAGVAFVTLQNWLVGAQVQSLTFDSNGSWVVQLHTPSGTRAYIVWNPNAAETWAVPANFEPQQAEDLFGDWNTVTGATSIAIGPQPVLIVGG